MFVRYVSLCFVVNGGTSVEKRYKFEKELLGVKIQEDKSSFRVIYLTTYKKISFLCACLVW